MDPEVRHREKDVRQVTKTQNIQRFYNVKHSEHFIKQSKKTV